MDQFLVKFVKREEELAANYPDYANGAHQKFFLRLIREISVIRG